MKDRKGKKKMRMTKNLSRRFRRSLRAISPIIAVLLIIVITVAAALVAYSWSMGYIGFTTGRVGQAVQIQSISRTDAGVITAYVQNIGDSDVVLTGVYLDGVLDSGASPIPYRLNTTATVPIVLGLTSLSDQVTVKVATADGYSMELLKVFRSSSGGGGGNGGIAPSALDSFVFDTISSPQISGTPFSITIRAIDQYSSPFTSYAETNTLICSTGTIAAETTTAFIDGVWTGSVTIIGSGADVTIETSSQADPSKTGTSNTFDVNSQQVAYVSAGTGSGTTGNPTPAYPGSLQAYDLILLQVTVRDDSNSPTTPAGFNLLYGPDSSNDFSWGIVRQWIYYKFATGAESGTITINIGGSNCKMARMYAFRNVALSNFNEGGGFLDDYDDVIDARSVTTSGPLRLAVSFVFMNDNVGLDSFSGESGGNWIEAEEYQTSAGSDGVIQLQTAIMANAGTISGGSDDTGFWNYNWGVRAFALIPA